MNNFSTNLKELRENKGLTQREIASLLDISQVTYCNWENDKTEPDLNNLIRLCKFFMVSTDYLLGIESEDGRIIIQEPELPSDENKLLSNYRALTDELKMITQEYVKTLNNLSTEYRKAEQKKPRG